MKSMIQMGFLAVFFASLLTTTAWAETKPPVKQPAKLGAKPADKPAAANQPVQDTEFKYPAALGTIPCDDNVSVTVSKDSKRPDGFIVAHGKTNHLTTRVSTDSGAIRLENKATGTVWLQMANKSMLFNEKAGKRLANNCRNDEQIAAEKALESSTAATVLDAASAKKP